MRQGITGWIIDLVQLFGAVYALVVSFNYSEQIDKLVTAPGFLWFVGFSLMIAALDAVYSLIVRFITGMDYQTIVYLMIREVNKIRAKQALDSDDKTL